MSDIEEKLFLNGTERQVDAMLAFFLYECPTSMIPSVEQVRDWGRLLEGRGAEFAKHASMCAIWPDE